MRCTNAGSSFDEHDVEWTCTASLPREFKLGSTDVICEGYDSPEDPYILKGSCGVEYRLVLTEEGEQKFGKPSSWSTQSSDEGGAGPLFWVLLAVVAALILYSIWKGGTGNANDPNPRGGWGGGGGGGGDDNDPPPPYNWQPPRKPSTNQAQSSSWRPGFWSGAAAAGAAGYAAGRYSGNQTDRRGQRSSNSWRSDNGEGSSSSGGISSQRYESTGFGSTSRR